VWHGSDLSTCGCGIVTITFCQQAITIRRIMVARVAAGGGSRRIALDGELGRGHSRPEGFEALFQGTPIPAILLP
jgi:hypothetical protein